MNGWGETEDEQIERWLEEKVEDLVAEICDRLDNKDLQHARMLLLDAVGNV